jgi:hypothetical protein
MSLRGVRSIRTTRHTNAVRGIVILAFVLAFPLISRAAPVDSTTARAATEAFIKALDASAASIARVAIITGDQRPLAYIMSLDPRGYVVVAADDGLPPVIAYSLESNFRDDVGPDNPLERFITVDLRSRLAALPLFDPARAESQRRAWSELADGTFARGPRFDQWPPAGTTPTGGWLASNWTQDPPYNALCPRDLAHGGARSLAGCPAVAMAMIVNYYATIHGTSFASGDRYWHSYAGNSYWIPDAAMQYGFPDFATLNGYLQTLTQHWDQSTPLTNTDKAALTFACGVAARQVYSASGSGTFGVDQAYDAYQRFAFDGSRLVLDSDPELYPDMARQMRDAQPAHLAVVDPGWTTGHNVVVDGWNTDNYFHLNFGWGGAYNGWYLLPQGMPFNLTVIEGVILDIAPDPAAVPERPISNDRLALFSAPNPFQQSVTLSFTAPVEGRARLGLYDISGRLRVTVMDGEVRPGPFSVIWAPERLPAGVYLARLQLAGRVETRRVVLAP